MSSFRTLLLSAIVLATCPTFADDPSSVDVFQGPMRLGESGLSNEDFFSFTSIGQWRLEVDGKPVIVSVYHDLAKRLGGQWIDEHGILDLSNVSFRDKRLRFVSIPTGDRQLQWRLAGSTVDDELVGTASNDRDGASYVEGTRIRETPPEVGRWSIGFRERRVNRSLQISMLGDGRLVAGFRLNDGMEPIDVHIADGKFEFELGGADFRGALRSTNVFDGKLETARAEASMAFMRIGRPIIGYWQCDLSDSGSDQRLVIMPDFSGWFGPYKITEIECDDLETYAQVLGGEELKQASLSFSYTDAKGVEHSFIGEVTGEQMAGKIDSGTEMTARRRHKWWAATKFRK